MGDCSGLISQRHSYLISLAIWFRRGGVHSHGKSYHLATVTGSFSCAEGHPSPKLEGCWTGSHNKLVEPGDKPRGDLRNHYGLLYICWAEIGHVPSSQAGWRMRRHAMHVVRCAVCHGGDHWFAWSTEYRIPRLCAPVPVSEKRLIVALPLLCKHYGPKAPPDHWMPGMSVRVLVWGEKNRKNKAPKR